MLALRLKSLQFFARTFSQKANKYKQLDTNLGNNLNQIPVLPAGTNPKAASLSLMQKLKLSPVPSTSALVTPQSPTSASTQNEQKDRLAKYHKIGPQLQMTKILIKNGELTSKEIYRSYLLNIEQKRKNKEKYIPYFSSLTELKKILGFMRTNGKISSAGYDKKKRLFKGWKIDQKRALKYVHPQVKEQLEKFKSSRDQL